MRRMNIRQEELGTNNAAEDKWKILATEKDGGEKNRFDIQ